MSYFLGKPFLDSDPPQTPSNLISLTFWKFISLSLTEINFISGDKILCKHCPKWNVHQNIGSFWNAAETKLHVNRTYFHAGLKSQSGMSSCRLYHVNELNLRKLSKLHIPLSNIIFRSRARKCFCLSEVREYWLLICSSNLSKLAYNFYTCT